MYIFTIYMVQCFESMYSVFDNKGCHICLLFFLFICSFHFYYFRFFVKSCSLSDFGNVMRHQVSPSNIYIITSEEAEAGDRPTSPVILKLLPP